MRVGVRVLLGIKSWVMLTEDKEMKENVKEKEPSLTQQPLERSTSTLTWHSEQTQQQQEQQKRYARASGRALPPVNNVINGGNIHSSLKRRKIIHRSKKRSSSSRSSYRSGVVAS